MTEEVKKALNWWRAYGGQSAFPTKGSRCAEVLADAFAELHQPDDDERATADWAKTPEPQSIVHLWENCCGDTIAEVVVPSEIVNPTRGQLRRLIAALES